MIVLFYSSCAWEGCFLEVTRAEQPCASLMKDASWDAKCSGKTPLISDLLELELGLAGIWGPVLTHLNLGNWNAEIC